LRRGQALLGHRKLIRGLCHEHYPGSRGESYPTHRADLVGVRIGKRGMKGIYQHCGEKHLHRLKHLFIASALTIVLAACGLPAERDVRAYDACMSRDPQEAALCEGPRQAYEVDTATFQARAAAYSLPAGGSDHELPAAAHPALTPVPLLRAGLP
jgi:hypothetical protein